MSVVEQLVAFRGVERLLITVGGIVCIICGLILYKWGTSGVSQLHLQFKGFKLDFLDAAPGLILGLFGIAVLIVGLINNLSLDLDDASTKRLEKVGEAVKRAEATGHLKFSYSAKQEESLDHFLKQFTFYGFQKLKEDDLRTAISTFQKDAKTLRDDLAKKPQ